MSTSDHHPDHSTSPYEHHYQFHSVSRSTSPQPSPSTSRAHTPDAATISPVRDENVNFHWNETPTTTTSMSEILSLPINVPTSSATSSPATAPTTIESPTLESPTLESPTSQTSQTSSSHNTPSKSSGTPLDDIKMTPQTTSRGLPPMHSGGLPPRAPTPSTASQMGNISINTIQLTPAKKRSFRSQHSERQLLKEREESSKRSFTGDGDRSPSRRAAISKKKDDFHQHQDDHEPPNIVVTSPGGTDRVIEDAPSKPQSLEFQFNNAVKNRTRGFPSNVVRTSKYTILTFLPINLFEQFRRLANAYFLLIVLVQVIPGVSPFPIWTSLAPLLFILAMSAANEIREDYHRHKADQLANSRDCILVTEQGTEIHTASKNIEVGNILKVMQGEEIPADMILLSSSHADATAYVNTANLDGEAAPKARFSPVATMEYADAPDLAKIRGTVLVEHPNASFYHFQGSLILHDDSGKETSATGVGDKQLLLRGAKIVNTEYVYGIVAYTGSQTKMMLNRNPARYKFSRFEKTLNSYVIFVLIFNAIICLIPSIYYIYVDQSWNRREDLDVSSFQDWILGFITQYILFSFMIPMSLYVTIELVKVGQAFFIMWDRRMGYTDPDTGQYSRAVVKSAALNEELGVVDVICSDKTGTLTQNKMELNVSSVFGNMYYDIPRSTKESMTQHGGKLLTEDIVAHAFHSGASSTDEHKQDISDIQSTTCREFIYNLCLCNAVIPSQQVPDDESSWIFEAQSPDEIALMQALHRVGVTLAHRQGGAVTIRVRQPGGQYIEYKFDILATLEFSSAWRRMSVLMRYPDGSIHLFVKGADTTIEALITQHDPIQKDLLSKTMLHATQFAATGSRTLVMAGKILTESEYAAWLPKYKTAENSLGDRELEIEKAFRGIEVDMNLLGCTAVDDQLQERVPETIDFLLAAKIKVIVLTGDKKETAVTISRQSHLIGNHVKLLYVDGLTKQDCLDSLRAAQSIVDEEWKKARTLASSEDVVTSAVADPSHEDPHNPQFALAIDGVALELCLSHHEQAFLALFRQLITIVSYRSTPLQKAKVVRMVKERLHLTCLAIGDGANDVSMIQEAHVGIGIQGKEGAHAAMSSDFVIKRFCHLQPLIFLHGRYSYWRTSQVVLFSFYKNAFFPMPLFWFEFWSMGTGVALFDATLMSNFNMFFSSTPPFFVGIMDKDVPEATLLSTPIAYHHFKRENPFTPRIFTNIMLLAVYHSLVVYFAGYAIFAPTDVISPDGYTEGFAVFGNVMLTAIVIVVNVQMLIKCRWVTWLNWFSFWFGIVWYLAIFWFITLQYLPDLSPDIFGGNKPILGSIVTYFYCAWCLVVCLLPVSLLERVQRHYWPTYSQRIERLPPGHVGMHGDLGVEMTTQARKSSANDTAHVTTTLDTQPEIDESAAAKAVATTSNTSSQDEQKETATSI